MAKRDGNVNVIDAALGEVYNRKRFIHGVIDKVLLMVLRCKKYAKVKRLAEDRCAWRVVSS